MLFWLFVLLQLRYKRRSYFWLELFSSWLQNILKDFFVSKSLFCQNGIPFECPAPNIGKSTLSFFILYINQSTHFFYSKRNPCCFLELQGLNRTSKKTELYLQKIDRRVKRHFRLSLMWQNFKWPRRLFAMFYFSD